MPDLSLFMPLCTLLDVTLNELFAGERIAEEKLKEKTDGVLMDVITNWLGHNKWESKEGDAAPQNVLEVENVSKLYENVSIGHENILEKLTRLFLCEVLLIGFCCYIAGTTIGFSIYGLWYFREPLHGMRQCGFLYGKSMFYTFLFFCPIETVCSFRLRRRLNKLQIRELMYERNCSQSVENIGSYKKWGILFFLCFVCFIGCVCGIVFLPEVYIVYPISVVAIPLIVSVFAFYKWVFGYLYAYRRMKPVQIYQKDRLYIAANITSNFKTAATVNAVFCICFLFSGCSFVTGMLMLQPEFQFFDTVMRQWMGASQISICIVFLVIYFSILSLQQIIEVRQNSKGNQIMRYMGKSNKQIAGLVNKQIAIRLISPMIMALLAILFCVPLLNGKMNLILPVSLNNILLKLAGGFGVCIVIFYICYFGIICVMSKRYINASHDKQ